MTDQTPEHIEPRVDVAETKKDWGTPEIRDLDFNQAQGNQFNSTIEATFGLLNAGS